MEVAIPILAVGGWFLSCEQKKNEQFQNNNTNKHIINNYTLNMKRQ